MRLLKLLAISALLLASSGVVEGRARFSSWCTLQNAWTRVTGCTVTVYLTGTSTLATLFADNSSTAQANPFTANATSGIYTFYADNGRYDVRLSGGTPTISPAYTLADVLLLDTGTSGQSTTFAGDIIPATDNTGNVGTASFTWAGGRFTAMTIDGAATVGTTLGVTGASTLTGAVTTGTTLSTGGNLSVTGTGAFTGAVSGAAASFTTGTFSGAVSGSSTGSFTSTLTASAGIFGTTPSTTGILRVPNNQFLIGRDAGNANDRSIIGLNSSDVVQISATGRGTNILGFLALGSATVPSGTTIMRIPNNTAIVARNFAGAADVNIAQVLASDVVNLGPNSGGQINLGSASTESNIGRLQMQGRMMLGNGITAFVDLDTTPDVSGASVWTTANTGATSITSLDSGTTNQLVLIRCNDTNTTFVDGGNLALSANLVCTVNDTLTLWFDGTNWLELSRSVN